MLLDNWISLDTWITFGASILNIDDTVGALRDTMTVRYGTMCNLRYVDKIADWSHRPKRVNFRVFGHFLENRGGKGLKFGMLMYPDHRPHSRQVTEARYTEGATRQSRAEYSSRPTTEAEQWPVCWLQCLIKKWSCVNSQFRLHTQVAYKPHIHDTWHKIQSHQFGNPFLGTLARHVHFRQWLCVCAVKIGASYFVDLFSTCQQVPGHACHIWYMLGLKLFTQNHSTRAGRLRIRCVMTGHDAGMGVARCF